MNLAGLIKNYKNKLFPFLQISKSYKFSTSVQIQSNTDKILKRASKETKEKELAKTI